MPSSVYILHFTHISCVYGYLHTYSHRDDMLQVTLRQLDRGSLWDICKVILAIIISSLQFFSIGIVVKSRKRGEQIPEQCP